MRSGLSVIVPVYNVAPFLPRCIESILAQTFTDFELILVDDGSTDGSSAILDLYAAKHQNVKVYHQSHRGPGASRNFGISKASKDWLCFIDSDDWVESNHLANYFKEDPNELIMVSQGILFDSETEGRQWPFFSYKDDEFLLGDTEKVIKNKILHNGCPYCKLFSKRVIQNNRIMFDTNISIHEDHLFVFDYLQYVKGIRLIESLSYHYMQRISVNSLTKLRHTSAEYLIFYNHFIEDIDILSARMGLIASQYIKSLYSLYGLKSLLSASLQGDDKTYRALTHIELRNDLIEGNLKNYISIIYIWLMKKSPRFITDVGIYAVGFVRKTKRYYRRYIKFFS